MRIRMNETFPRYFYRNKNLFKIDDIDINKIIVSKREPYDRKAHLNSLLGMMIIMTLDYYVLSFCKWLGILNPLKVIIQCFLKSMIKNW